MLKSLVTLRTILACACIGSCCAGCAGPIHTPRDPASTPADQRRSMVTTSPTAISANSPSVDRLTVNGESVEVDELWRGVHAELRQAARTLSSTDYKAFVRQTAARLIREKIAEMLLYQRAVLMLPPKADAQIGEHVDAAIRRIVATDHGGVRRRYEKYLASTGLTLAAKRQAIRREIVISQLLEQEIKPRISEPTRAELLEAYEALRTEVENRPRRRRMSLVDIRIIDRLPSGTNNPTREQYAVAKAEALTRANDAQAELLRGTPFAEVARRFSDGLHAEEGGVWGWITKGSVRERFEPVVEALFELRAGEVSEIIKVDDGFFLVRCEDIDEAATPDFQDVQPMLIERLISHAHNSRIVKLVAKLRSKARIEPADLEQFHRAVVAAAPEFER